MKSRMSLKMGYVGSETRLLVQMLEKSYVYSGGHIFRPMIMKLDQHLYKISHIFENESCWVKN